MGKASRRDDRVPSGERAALPLHLRFCARCEEPIRDGPTISSVTPDRWFCSPTCCVKAAQAARASVSV